MKSSYTASPSSLRVGKPLILNWLLGGLVRAYPNCTILDRQLISPGITSPGAREHKRSDATVDRPRAEALR
jgi:hypothetical protein